MASIPGTSRPGVLARSFRRLRRLTYWANSDAEWRIGPIEVLQHLDPYSSAMKTPLCLKILSRVGGMHRFEGRTHIVLARLELKICAANAKFGRVPGPLSHFGQNQKSLIVELS